MILRKTKGEWEVLIRAMNGEAGKRGGVVMEARRAGVLVMYQGWSAKDAQQGWACFSLLVLGINAAPDADGTKD